MEYIRKNILTSHSLHDMVVGSITIEGSRMTLHMETGLVRCQGACPQCPGSVVFEGVDQDFCFAYILQGFTANEGHFRGEKLPLAAFIQRYPALHFEIIDACYGYDQTKLSGWLPGGGLSECTLEITHRGDMIFVEE